MCVRVCTFVVCVCVHVCMYAGLHVCMRMYACTIMHVYGMWCDVMHVCMYVCMCGCRVKALPAIYGVNHRSKFACRPTGADGDHGDVPHATHLSGQAGSSAPHGAKGGTASPDESVRRLLPVLVCTSTEARIWHKGVNHSDRVRYEPRNKIAPPRQCSSLKKRKCQECSCPR